MSKVIRLYVILGDINVVNVVLNVTYLFNGNDVVHLALYYVT